MECDAGNAGQSVVERTVDLAVAELLNECTLQQVTEACDPCALFRQAAVGRCCRRSRTRDAGDVECPGSPTTFLPSAEDQRVVRERGPAADEEGPHPLRAAELVSRQGQQVHVDLGEVDR